MRYWLHRDRHDIGRADFHALAFQIAFAQIPRVHQGFAIDHLQNILLAVGDADFAADAVADVDGERGFEAAVAAGVLADESANGGDVFAADFQAEIGFEMIESRL